MANITLKNIYKIYDKNHEAVKDFNLQIEDQEFIVFVGPSGCGKSTTLRMIAGLEEISKGELYIDNQLMNAVEPKNRDIAMVFQSYALYPHMTVFDNMAFGLKLAKVSKAEIEKRVNEAAKTLGLEPYLKRKPKALSGGQRQRVALGRAIVREAKVFLMDEPLSNLDAKLRVQMRAEIQKLHNKIKTTTIYVTHDQTEAMTTRIVVMKDGVIQQIGTPNDVYQNPKNVFIASFIGSPAMNFFQAKIENGHYIIGDYKLIIPSNYKDALANKNHAIVGIRPEHITISKEESMENSITSIIEVEELLGSESYVHSTLNGQPFITKVVGESNLVIGEKKAFHFNSDKLYFFDEETEEVISPKIVLGV